MPEPVRFKGAYLTERGVNFAIVQVEPKAAENEFKQNETAEFYEKYFPEGTPVILMVLNKNNIKTEGEEEKIPPAFFYGRRDIVAFLSTIELNQIKWKNYNHPR